jgi:hypothetical protein
MSFRLVVASLATLLSSNTTSAEPLSVPFDFSHAAIGVTVTIRGAPLYMLLDTGVDPSVIDLKRAEALGLTIDRAAGGEAAGMGDAKEAKAFPATIDTLAIGGRLFHPIDAAAMDMGTLSARYGHTLDGVLGYSFLTDKIVLIDYPRHTFGILDRPADALSMALSCRKHWSIALESTPNDSVPILPVFHFGAISAPIALDTGSNGGIALYPAALALPGLRDALIEMGEATYTGARGEAKGKTYMLKVPVGFGPFALPAGQVATLETVTGVVDVRIADFGNKLLAAMKLKVLLDYRDRVMTFYGDCRGTKRVS